MVWLPINYRNALESNIELLGFFDTDCLIFHSQFEDQIAQIREQVPSIKMAVCIDTESAHAESMESLISDCSSDFPYQREEPNAPCILLGTGGTTGPSKGVSVI